MNFKAILFDLDGTLLDTLDDLADSMNAVLARMGLAAHPVDAYKYFVGDGMRELARRVLPEDRRDDALVGECLDLMREEYESRWHNKTRTYQGIPELLDAVTARGVVQSVLSNKSDEFTRKVVSNLLGKWKFAIVRGQVEGVARKPDAAGALLIAGALKVSPDQMLYLGDTATDMKTATAAGMYPVGALWGFRTAEELLDNGAKQLVETPAEVIDLL
jgi:phosphoglycolate phosphatase